MDPLIITIEVPQTADVRALLVRHFDLMRANSPAESCHVMPPDTVAEAGVTMFGARRDGLLLGIGAVKSLDAQHGELKSMHTAADARGMGVGREILRALMDYAREIGLGRLSLETGSAPLFAPARALYEAEGFGACPPFASYVPDRLSVFMSRAV